MNDGSPAGLDDGSHLDGRLAQALEVALEALDERAANSGRLLTDPALYGLVDLDQLRSSLDRDEDASEVLRSALGSLSVSRR